MNVGFKVEYKDKQGTQRVLYALTLRGAYRLGVTLEARGYTNIRISDIPQSVEKAKKP